MTTQAERRLIAAWLAEADPHPEAVWAEWETRGAALVPLGRRFDAVRVPAERMHTAVRSVEPQTVAPALRAWVEGPVIRDLRSPGGPYYVLIPVDAQWDGEEDRLSTNTLLGVPRPGHVSMLMRWIVEPQAPGHLCDPRYLRALLATADPLRTVGR
ncbi:hypothetical protein GCM10018785_32410 [Streptomyces longispororuber]|uniref:Uncharacterized protein n=1 Tax=Streptomyces longispororuber TaxID=68230 RepID=A0A918ZNM9_9ACTN|nr:hypothetical protein [Streptomyces longispororuber]GHE60838.1 hypothetical protein GCM10018785_32410 [Streptomyces longispororuber]